MATPSPTLADRLLDQFFITGVVDDVTWVTPRMRRVSIGGPELRGLDWTPGQQVRVCVVTPRSWLGPLMTVLRTYSVWDYADTPVNGGVLQLCILDHGDGPGTTWAREVRAGHHVRLSRPKGDFTLRQARHHVFVGEETASTAFGAMLRALPADAAVHGVIEVDDPSDRLPLARAGELTWLYRRGASAASSQPLADAVAALDLPRGDRNPDDAPAGDSGGDRIVAYVAGEAHTCQAVRRQLVTRHGWHRRAVVVKPFWAPGKRGME